MAQQTTVRFIDDLDGSDAVGTVTFSLDNRSYEIDLSDENTDKLHEALAPFIEHGRKVGGRSGGRRWVAPVPAAAFPEAAITNGCCMWSNRADHGERLLEHPGPT